MSPVKSLAAINPMHCRSYYLNTHGTTTTREMSKQGPAGGGKRTKTTEKRLKMYATRAKRDKHGKVVWEAFKSKSTDHIARIQPDRRWFGPSRTATPEAIDKFREQVKNVVDPYHESNDADPSNTNPAPLTPGSTVARHTYLLKQAKIPYSLLHTRDHFPNAINNRILDVESYASTFGPKNTRKRPKVAASDYGELLKRVETTQESYKEDADRNIKVEQEYKEQQGDAVLTAGQSNRIHNELHKVIDASDVLIQVLDARDPEGTRSRWLEKYLRKEHPHKHLVLLLNKCDLVPQKVTKQWLSQFSREYPCLAFHASLQRPFGKGALIQILRQFQQLHAKDKQQISVGFVGYPNVGKSSVINTLRHKKVCNVAPLPGETKVWQYITLFKRVFLIDCPGVVTAVDVAKHNTQLEDQYLQQQLREDGATGEQDRDQPGSNVVSEKEAALVLKGVVRIENLTDPVSYIGPLLTRVNLEYMQRVYQCEVSTNHVTFLETLAKKMGKLLKGGHPDITRVARIVLNDWLRGKIPFYTKPAGTRDTVRSKDLEQLRAPSQLIENIPVKEEFKELFHEEFEDDAEALDEALDEAQDAADEEDVSDADQDAAEDEAPVDWDAVYASVNPEQDFNTIHQHENKGAKNSSVGLPKAADLPKLELQAPLLSEESEGSARGRGRSASQGKVAGKVDKKQRGKAKKKSQLKSEDEIKSLLRTLESIEGTANLHGAGQQYKNRNAGANKKKRARSEQAEDFEIVPQDARVKRRKVTPHS